MSGDGERQIQGAPPVGGASGTEQARQKPRFGVRLDRGIVTYWGDVPLTTWEMANECLEKIEALTGERGEVEEVFVL